MSSHNQIKKNAIFLKCIFFLKIDSVASENEAFEVFRFLKIDGSFANDASEILLYGSPGR